MGDTDYDRCKAKHPELMAMAEELLGVEMERDALKAEVERLKADAERDELKAEVERLKQQHRTVQALVINAHETVRMLNECCDGIRAALAQR